MTFRPPFDDRMDMVVIRTIVVTLAAITVMAAAGDCASLLFGDAHAIECCTRGGCVQKSQTDACCAVPMSGSARYFQTGTKISDSHNWTITTDLLSQVLGDHQPAVRAMAASFSDYYLPPITSDISLPLLI